MVSTSFHTLNNDRGLSQLSKIKWIFYNYINNRMPTNNLDLDLQLTSYKNNNYDIVGQNFDPTLSPSRRVCDIFWNSIRWETISKNLNCSVHALEMGCGSGLYGDLLSKKLGNDLIRYKGVDIKPHESWENYYQNSEFSFEIGDSNSILSHLENVNLIITQSALEHFEEDLNFFNKIAKTVNNMNAPIIQIHLIPSAQCLYTYFWHGVRQYTPRNISKISRLFNSKTKKFLYSLGGYHCNRVHRKYISIPKRIGNGDKRFVDTEKYLEEVNDAIKNDQKIKDKKSASFYALVLNTNISNPII